MYPTHFARRSILAVGLCAFLLSIAISAGLRAETFVLSNGGRVVGELLNPDETPRTKYVVRTMLGTVTLVENQVRLVRSKSEAEKWYERWVAKMPDTLEGNVTMAEACRERGLTAQRRIHLENILRFDPDHEPARLGLGYTSIDDKWVLTESWKRSQGLIRHLGEWRTRQEVEVIDAYDHREDREKEWWRRVKMWRTWVLKGRDRQAKGLQNIGLIDDPLASRAIVDTMEKEKNLEFKKILIQTLGRLQTGEAAGALISTSLEHPSEAVRDACHDELKKFARHMAAGAYVSKAGLQNSDNKVVNRAAVGLARMNDPQTIPELIDALTTKHKSIHNTSSGQINPVFGANGGGGLNMSGKPKIVTRDVANPKVRDALLVMIGGVDFEYNKPLWKRWLVNEYTPRNVNLRRGE
ncbi:MAG: hypothetical protein QF805_01925 [Pirellulaceae bacterium]|nr:hypothetical protein [Pirellulaceae bacterium]